MARMTWPVVEIFGPTIQGEGVDQGVVSHFVRFGGCDYRCTWCDTPHAVLPAEVRNAERLDVDDILNRLNALEGVSPTAPWIVLTGGNPALHDLSTLVTALQASGFKVAVETQGSRWRDWMGRVDRLCVSPKPPSSKEPKAKNLMPLVKFMHEAMRARVENEPEWVFLKIVIFNDEDLDYAEHIHHQLFATPLYLSAGNDAGRTVGEPDRIDNRSLDDVRRDLLTSTLWLTEEVFKRPALCASDVFVQSQLHVAIWGNELGR